KVLRREYPCSYWGVDVKRRPGGLQVDSLRVIGIGRLDADVIDVDTYGSPWKHWMALLPQITRPTTVFVTEGIVRMGGGVVDSIIGEAMGLRFPSLRMPTSLAPKLGRQSWRYAAALARNHGLRVEAIVEALHEGTARYYGFRLAPADLPPAA